MWGSKCRSKESPFVAEMAGFYLSNNRITAQNINHIYGGPKALLKSPRETKTYYLRCKEKEEERAEAVRRKAKRLFYERGSDGEYVVPKAPAFKGVDHNSVEEIVTRLNRPKTALSCHHQSTQWTKKDKRDVRSSKPRTEKDLTNIFSRLHCQNTYMSRVRSSCGGRLPPPGRQSAIKRSRSAPPQGTNYREMIKKWNLHLWTK